MKSLNPIARAMLLLRRVVKGCSTHLRIEVVHASNRVGYVTSLQCFSDVHPTFDAVQVDGSGQPSFVTKLFCGRLEAFDDKVVHDEAI